MISTATKLAEANIQTFLAVKSAFDECSPEVQAVVTEMLGIYNNPASSQSERQLAINTVIEAVFPGDSAETLEMERVCARSAAAQAHAAKLAGEEQFFSERVRSLLKEKGLTQEELAQRIGISQPAVANMLNRNCRPQKKTVARFADVLGVSEESLWPQENAVF
jgi:lambda repressor-like predicted transcriptional regulator